MCRSKAIALCLLILACASSAQETKAGAEFEEVSAPQVNLQLAPESADAPPAEPGTPQETAPVPGTNAPTPATPEAADSLDKLWAEHQSSLDEALGQTPGASDAGAAQSSAAGRSTARSFLQGGVAFCVVIALILIAYYLLNRYGKKTPIFAGASLGQILGRLHLSSKAMLYFVRVKDKVLVVGVSTNEVTRIAEFDAALFESTVEPVLPQAATKPAKQSFIQELKEQTQPKAPAVAPQPAPAEPPVDDEIAALRNDLERLQQYLQESSRDTEN